MTAQHVLNEISHAITETRDVTAADLSDELLASDEPRVLRGLIRDWPAEAMSRSGLNEATYVAVLSHDLKIDLPALEAAMRSPARYIGALGSRKTHAKRVAALEERGFTAEQIARIHGPAGLHIGSKRPAEIALSILAEITAIRNGIDNGDA